MMAADILTGLRMKWNDVASIYRATELMTELTAYDEAVEEGELRGAIKNNHVILLRLGRTRFGAPDAEVESERLSDALTRFSTAYPTS